MKKKCIICDQNKGKRSCIQYDKAMVCPKCCAQIRNPSCATCSYYKTAEKYAEDKFRKSGGKSFVIELNEEVDTKIKTVEYYKEFPMKNRSYIQHFIEEGT